MVGVLVFSPFFLLFFFSLLLSFIAFFFFFLFGPNGFSVGLWLAWLAWYGFGSIIIGGVLFSLSLSLLCVCVCVACMG